MALFFLFFALGLRYDFVHFSKFMGGGLINLPGSQNHTYHQQKIPKVQGNSIELVKLGSQQAH